MLSAEEWLDNEDIGCRQERLNRLKWLLDEYPNIDISIFHGAPKSYLLFEEARYCFVYGQHVASVLLCLSYIENTLASIFYAFGRDDLQRATVADLLEEARDGGLITECEFALFDRVRRARNPIAHFRKPANKETIEYWAVEGDMHPYEVLEQHTRTALRACFRLMAKFSIPRGEEQDQA
jgi:hypothetical protein